MKERKFIVESDLYELMNRLNKSYADWEIAAAFYELDDDFMLLILEREVNE